MLQTWITTTAPFQVVRLLLGNTCDRATGIDTLAAIAIFPDGTVLTTRRSHEI
ncbi:hypothetical protein ACN4EG_03630 [Alkalinema pantanalense CENA528]|uniref:hypothetical protein n=1 Tax=Alkalinema pantanalense TaxID=1620705 RepID=UPI003D6E1241